MKNDKDNTKNKDSSKDIRDIVKKLEDIDNMMKVVVNVLSALQHEIDKKNGR